MSSMRHTHGGPTPALNARLPASEAGSAYRSGVKSEGAGIRIHAMDRSVSSATRLAPLRLYYVCRLSRGIRRVGNDRAHGRAPAKATSFDIAYLAGVSQPTVSRALRGRPQ